MDELTWMQWVAAVVAGTPVPGSYTPGTNPLDVMTG